MRRKRIMAAVLLFALMLSGCSRKQEKFQAVYVDLFDTVTTIVGYGDSEEEFQALAQTAHDRLLEYHRLFDIYREYDGMNNLKTVNDQAGVAPVPVDNRILELLTDCKAYYTLTNGRVNVAMGSVLTLWHTAREDSLNDPEQAYIPDAAALAAAAEHTDLNNVILHPETSEVFLADAQTRLDVGAVAKGWAVEKVAATLPAGLLLNVGGNICATGSKNDGTPWIVGIQDPDGGNTPVCTMSLTCGSYVTSGDYQRCFRVNGKKYHHIIDPDTCYPSEDWRSVTVYAENSGLADALSTALFLMPLEDGMALVEECGAQALWIASDGEIFTSPGFETLP